MRLGGETTDDFEAKTEGLAPYELQRAVERCVVAELCCCRSAPNFVRLMGRWLGVRVPHRPAAIGAGWRPSRRSTCGSAMLLTRFKSRRFGPVLATPTHRGGWIDPRVFVERLKSIRDIPWQVSRFDLIGGLLRLAPDFRDVALESAADLPNPFGPIVRYVARRHGTAQRRPIADRADEWLAAGRTRQPRGWLEELRVPRDRRARTRRHHAGDLSL